MHFRVVSPGQLTTVQDLGRLGYQRFGVPRSGAMDWFALRAANALVGNPVGAAGLEFTLDAPVLQASEDCLVAAAGKGYALRVQGRQAGCWRAALVRRGEVIDFTMEGAAGWGYLAVLGGFAVPPVMGSRSTSLRGAFGGWHGRVLQEGDLLPVGESFPGGWKRWAGRWLPPEKRPAFADGVVVPAVPGPQLEAFTEEAVKTFFSVEYAVSLTSDRMGYRFNGPRLAHRQSADLISEALPWGAVQVPADGLPMAMMSDRPTTGGYPKIAVVALAGLPLLAQAMPGTGRVRFQKAAIDTAQAEYRQMLGWIETGIEGDENGLQG